MEYTSRLPSRTALVAAATLLTLALALGAVSAADAATISGSVEGLPKQARDAKRVASVRAVRLETGEIAAAAPIRGRRFSLTVPAGRYVVMAAGADVPGRALSGSSRAVRVRSGRSARARVTTRRPRPAKRRRGGGRRAGARAAAGPSPLVIGPERILVSGTGRGKPDFHGVVITRMFEQGCPDGTPFRMVEMVRRADLIKEIELQRDPRFDQRTAVRPRFVNPEQVLQGSGYVENGRFSIDLRIVDVDSRKVIAEGSASGPVDQFLELTDAATSALLADLCGGRFDITFEGRGRYTRADQIDAEISSDSAADYTWTTTYRGIDLAASGPVSGDTTELGGGWSQDARADLDVPLTWRCGGAIASDSGRPTAEVLARATGATRVSMMPFVAARTDPATARCEIEALEGPVPVGATAFAVPGDRPWARGVVEIDPATVGETPVSFDVRPAEAIPASCEDLGSSQACSQGVDWSGRVTIARVPRQ